jgi:hypothetical protein
MEIQTATGNRRALDPLQVTLARLREQRADPTLVMPPGSVLAGALLKARDAAVLAGALLKARDAVRLTRDMDKTPGGSEGVVLGWYANEPENVVVSLSEGGIENLPREALELVDVRSVA